MAAGLAGCSRPHRGPQGAPRPAGKCSPTASPGTTWGLQPDGRSLNISEGKCPRGNLIRCLNNLTWLASAPISSSSTPSSFQISELLTLSLRSILSGRTSFRATCICGLVFLKLSFNNRPKPPLQHLE